MSDPDRRPFLDNGSWIVQVHIHDPLIIALLGIIVIMLCVLLMRERSHGRS